MTGYIGVRSKPQIKLWRRERGEDEESSLSEVREYDPVSENKAALFVFPGADAYHTAERKIIAGYAREAEKLLGGASPNPAVDIVVASYPVPWQWNVMEMNTLSNKNPSHTEGVITGFSRKYIVPLIEQGVPVTLLGHCAGGAMEIAIERSLEKIYRDAGEMTQAEIDSKLKSVVAISYGNISTAHSLQEQEASPRFTSVVFNSLGDTISQNAQKLVPDDHVPGTLSVHRMGRNSLLVTTHTGPSLINEGNKGPYYNDDPEGHETVMYTHRNSVTPSGSVLVLERAVRNAVTREGSVDPLVLITQEAREVPLQRQTFSAANLLPYEVQAIAEVTSGLSIDLSKAEEYAVKHRKSQTVIVIPPVHLEGETPGPTPAVAGKSVILTP